MIEIYLKILKKKWKLWGGIASTVLVLAAFFTLLKPFEYSAAMKFLVWQKGLSYLDPLAQARATERTSKSLGALIKTQVFMEEVLNSGFLIDLDLPYDEAKKRKIWENKIETQVDQDTGILKVTVYDTHPHQAQILAQAIGEILTKKISYFYPGEELTIKMVEEPLTSKYPTRPNLVLNLGGALVFGVLAGISYTLISAKELKLPRIEPSPIKTEEKEIIKTAFGSPKVEEEKEYKKDVSKSTFQTLYNSFKPEEKKDKLYYYQGEVIKLED